MRLFLLLNIACAASWCAAAPRGTGAEGPPQDRTKELLVGKWEDPTRPGNWWEFDKGGGFVAAIHAGVIRSRTEGTYRVQRDGSLELRVRVGGHLGEPLEFQIKVTKDRLTFVNEAGKEDSYQRAK